MKKRFRCGRAIITKDGVVKHKDHDNGGGSLYCEWTHPDMRFTDVHRSLLRLYDLKGCRSTTSLYDSKLRPIYYKKYLSFKDYMRKTGLCGNNVCVYLCTREVNNINESRVWTTNNNNSSTSQKELHTQTSIEHRRHVSRDESYSSQEQNDLSVGDNLLNYSFTTSSNELMGNIQELIQQNSYDEILMSIFKYVSIIHGSVSSTIDLLIQKMQQSNDYFQFINQSEVTLYSNSLNNIYDTCQSTEILFNQNKYKFGHIKIFSTIKDSFFQFYENLKNLRNQWLEGIEKKFNTPTSSSSFTHSNIQSTSLQDYDERTNERYSLFLPVLTNLYRLLNLLNSESSSSSLQELVELSIDKIKHVEAFINLNNGRSIRDGKGAITFIRDNFIKESNELDNNELKSDTDQQINELCEKILTAVNDLFPILDSYQLEVIKNNTQSGSKSSSLASSSNDEIECIQID